MARGFVLETPNGDFTTTVDVSEIDHLDTSPGKANLEIIGRLLDGWLCLLADSPLNASRRSGKPSRVFGKFRRELIKGPLLTVIKHYSSLADELLKQAHLHTPSNTGGWTPGMVDTPVFKEYHVWYTTGKPELLSYVLSFLMFGKKLDYEDPELNATAFRGWLQVEERLSDLSLDSRVTNVMRRIMSGLVPDLPADPLMPKFGPGAVAERDIRGRIAKSNNLRYDAKLDRAFFRGHYAAYGLLEELGYHVTKVLPDPTTWDRANGVSGRISSLRFVPKDVGKSRSICMEPNSFMFAQQGVLRLLLSSVRKGIVRRFVNIEDQSRNRDLSRYGSRSGTIDTIDLSSASDSVSVELVRSIFSKKLLYYLLATRTSSVRTPTDEIVRVKKFAPMGSALCFPVQCLVFSCVVVYAAIAKAHGLPAGGVVPSDSSYLDDIEKTVDFLFSRSPGVVQGRLRNEPAAVYGDDICVDSSLTPLVTHLLSSLGFEVNISKSFTGDCSVRESCGGYYFNGEDVTPFRFTVARFRGKIGSDSVASMIASANRAGDRHYFNYRSMTIQYLLHSDLEGIRRFNGKNPIMFSDDRNLGYAFYSTHPRNTHLKSRYFVPWQRDEVLCIVSIASKVLRPLEIETPAIEAYLYLQWWGGRAGDCSSGGFTFGVSRNDSSGSRLSRKWVAA